MSAAWEPILPERHPAEAHILHARRMKAIKMARALIEASGSAAEAQTQLDQFVDESWVALAKHAGTRVASTETQRMIRRLVSFRALLDDEFGDGTFGLLYGAKR